MPPILSSEVPFPRPRPPSPSSPPTNPAHTSCPLSTLQISGQPFPWHSLPSWSTRTPLPKAGALPASQDTACLPSSLAWNLRVQEPHWVPVEGPTHISKEDSHTPLASICRLRPLLASHSAPSSQKSVQPLGEEQEGKWPWRFPDLQSLKDLVKSVPRRRAGDTIPQVTTGNSLYLPIPSLLLSLGPCQVLCLASLQVHCDVTSLTVMSPCPTSPRGVAQGAGPWPPGKPRLMPGPR